MSDWLLTRADVAVNHLPASPLWWSIHLLLGVGCAVAAAWGVSVVANPGSVSADSTRMAGLVAAATGPLVSALTIGKLLRHTDSEKLLLLLLLVVALSVLYCAYRAGSDQLARVFGLAAAAVMGWAAGLSAVSELITRAAATIPMPAGGFAAILVVGAVFGIAKAA